MATEKLVTQIRAQVNDDIARWRKLVEECEQASTLLASAQLDERPLRLEIYVDLIRRSKSRGLDDERIYHIEAISLNDAWQQVLKEYPWVNEDDVDIAYAPEGMERTFAIDSEHINAAYQEVKNA